ncbi:MAG: hypothetical protein HY019_02930 [Aquabacterium sp.]|uniref:hypothetical protein n=1 Tax=Aquabacterium sp. TaxID=1872578 RepID=UPI0025BBF2E4|nr:hypothetical protein [Aquabacterium sp.]MBI3380938.1 hypothetical protein [Aquabacterium sp.]
MSQHSGGRLARHHTPDKPGRPSLERPSLFAGMDNEPSSFDGDTQRVRILSTLESTRRPARGPMKIHGITKKKRSNWQSKALLGLMAVGVLSLLASFVMVLVNGHAPLAKPDAADQPAELNRPTTATKPAAASRVSPDNPLAALIAPPVRTAANTPTRPAQAAVIENVAIATPVLANSTTHGTTQSTTSAPAKMSATGSIAPVLPATAKSASTTTTASAKAEPAKPTLVAMAAPSAQASPQLTAAVLDASKQAKSAPSTSKRTQAGGRNDDDVALLEAMFAHTRPRPTESVAEEIKRRCGTLSGPDAATCRARVCVQNPTAAACHQD